MARVLTVGWEIDVSRTNGVEAGISGGGTHTRDTTLFRSGVASGKYNAGAGNAVISTTLSNVINLAASTSYYMRAYFCFTNLPASTVTILSFGDPASSAGLGARITSGGKLQLFNNVTSAQIGSDSAATISADGATWYRVELSVTINGSTQFSAVELRLGGTTVASTSGLTLATSNSQWVGWVFPAPGANNVLNIDDFAINNSAGAANNSWPGDGKVVVLVPISDSAVGSGWTGGAGGTSNLFAAVDSTPPVGQANPGTDTSQIRNASSAAASYDANLTSYTTAGVGASDTVNAVTPVCSVAAPVVTGAKTGSFGIVSNPTIANRVFTGGASAAANFWRGSAAGTYASGWTPWEIGTITDAPTVTLGTSPVARLTITGGTASRIAMCDFMGLYVDYTPAASGNTYTKAGYGIEHG